MLKYSVLINSTDSFEDCWLPFFTLFKKYWPEFSGKIYLNTETKPYLFDGLEIISVRNNIDNPNKKNTWSQCLRNALNSIDDEIILYLQEDYFFKDDIKNSIIEDYVHLMYNNSNIHCINLTDQAAPMDKPSEYEKLWYIPNKHRHKISLQASLWRKDVLLSYIRDYETAWNFEWWASRRAEYLNHNHFVVDTNWVVKDKFEIIPYIFTGVIGGRWNKEIIQLFSDNNITVDFDKRGFYEPRRITFKERIRKKLRRLPVEIRSFLHLLNLKYLSR